MRRLDKHIVEPDKIINLLKDCKACRIGLSFNDKPYIVPMNFGFEIIQEKIILYFHCAKEGKKLDIIKQNPHACFEMDTGHELVKGGKACDFSFKYKSLIGFGIAEFIDKAEEKKKALNMIMKKFNDKDDYDFDEKSLNSVTVFKIESDDYTAKGR